MHLEKNIHSAERILRAVIGLLILSRVFKSRWALLGLVPMFNAAVGWCALYKFLGIDTRNLGKREQEAAEAS